MVSSDEVGGFVADQRLDRDFAKLVRQSARASSRLKRNDWRWDAGLKAEPNAEAISAVVLDRNSLTALEPRDFLIHNQNCSRQTNCTHDKKGHCSRCCEAFPLRRA